MIFNRERSTGYARFKEALAGNNDARRAKALAQIFTLTDEQIDANDPLYRRIEKTLFPDGAQTQNEKNDVKVVYEAARYNAILVTRDGGSKTQPGGILGNREKLCDFVTIMSDTEAVGFIRTKIAERDEFNQRMVHKIGGKLPEWASKD